MTDRSGETPRGNTLRVVLGVFLLANTFMQLGGGIMMITRPERLASDTFGLVVRGDAASLVVVIGGATLSFALLSTTAAVGILRRREWAQVSVMLLGGMLLIVGAVMFVHGVPMGLVDLVKGVVFVVGGFAHRRRFTGVVG